MARGVRRRICRVQGEKHVREAARVHGVTVTGGEAFSQPIALAVLLKELNDRSLHTVVYGGYTLEVLGRRREPEVKEALRFIDLSVDAPFVPALADKASEWRSSRNQGLIPYPGRALLNAMGQTID